VNDVIDFTPALKAQALATLEQYRIGPLFTPPSLQGTVVMPGAIGGSGWGGGAFDPETGMYYVKATNSPALYKLVTREPSDTVDVRYMADLHLRLRPVRRVADGGTDGSAAGDDPGAGRGLHVPSDDLPIGKPPYGTLTAIDLNTGRRKWQIALGDTPRIRNNPLLAGLNLPPLGVAGAPGGIVTRGGIVFIAGGGNTLYAIDKEDGSTLWEADLGGRGYSNPMTYTTSTGRQFVVIATGGGDDARLMAFTLRGAGKGH
jgi:quinoprotein glucose dehydrogenase